MRVTHAVLVAGLVLLASLGGPMAAQGAPHSVWDDGPQGLGHLVSLRLDQPTLQGKPLLVAEGRIEPRAGWGLLSVEPQRAFSDAEVGALRAFLEDGGSAVLLGGTPALAELLLKLRAGLELGSGVYSPAYLRDAAFPLATGLGGSYALAQPRVVRGGTPLLTTGLAWEDQNGNGAPDVGEPVASYPVAARAAVGRGTLIVVGSASPLTRDGWAAGPGAALLGLLGPAIVVDEAHRVPLDPLGVSGLLAGAPEAALAPVVALAVGLVWALRPRVTRKDLAPEVAPGARLLVEASKEAQS